jgi:hypothetical protein
MDYILSSSKEGSKKEKGGRDTPISSEKKPRTRGQEKEKEEHSNRVKKESRLLSTKGGSEWRNLDSSTAVPAFVFSPSSSPSPPLAQFYY